MDAAFRDTFLGLGVANVRHSLLLKTGSEIDTVFRDTFLGLDIVNVAPLFALKNRA